MNHRGNPSWSRGEHMAVPNEPSKFERLLKREGLMLEAPCEELAKNPKVETFARKNYRMRFIPEKLLQLLGLEWRLPGDTGEL